MEHVGRGALEPSETTEVRLLVGGPAVQGPPEPATVRARRNADDLVEQDRMVADEQLRAFREDADAALTRERAGKRSAVEDARRRSDVPPQAQPAIPPGPAERARQADTDAKLGAERRWVDRTVESLSTAENALSTTADALSSTEEALSDAEDQVERRSQVLAMVAHELRNPLSVVTMNAEFIAGRASDPELCEAALEVRRSGARMGRLLLDLLDLARIEGGTFRIAKRSIDVGALLGDIRGAYGPLFTKRHVVFTCEAPPRGLVVPFDQDRVVQVLSNLLSNAMKATAAVGTVTLRVARREGEVEFAVEDTGTGIPADALPRVFNRFWQGSHPQGTGLGLGLYICEKIVAAHGGRIWVESEVGRGTAFRFTLPL